MNIKDLDNLKFKKPDPNTMTFKEIFEIYDDNFDKVYELLRLLYNNFIVEKFTGSTSRTITLLNSYTPNSNSLLVYKNGAIQWLGEGYVETSRNSIEMTADVKEEDVIRVIILDVVTSNRNNDEIIQELNDKITELTTKVEELSQLINK